MNAHLNLDDLRLLLMMNSEQRSFGGAGVIIDEDLAKWADEQVQAWKFLTVTAFTHPGLNDQDRNGISRLLDAATADYLGRCQRHQDMQMVHVKGPLPHLDTGFTSIFVSKNPRLAVGMIITELSNNLPRGTPPLNTSFSSNAIAAMAEYSSKKALLLSGLEVKIAELMKNVQTVEATQRAQQEYLALKHVTKVWEKRGEKLKLSVIISFIAIGAAILAILVAAFNSGPDFLNVLRSPEKNGQPGEITYGAVALAFVPIIAVGWLLRIVGRVTTTSLTLQDDAEHRAALLSTYFNLIGDANAKLEPSDRLLILTAIFRPLPGQDNDEMSPLAVEFVKKAFEKDGK